ncbi:MAG TPA: hypothetical protein VNS46_00980, partial [Nocardioides sp.]|nr:hypothetical protein [Nocardioides sp.]
RPKTSPPFAWSAEASITTGATLGVTLPAGAAAGQTAWFAVVHDGDATVTNPAGGTWSTEVAATPSSSVGADLTLFRYDVQSGDASTTKNFTLAGVTNQSAAVVVVAYTNVGAGYSVKPMIYLPLGTEAQNNRPPRFPSVICGPDDIVVAACATYAYLSTAADGAEVSAAPSNFTIRNTISRANNGLVVPRGVTVMDADGANVVRQHNTYSTAQVCYNVGVIFAISPVGPRSTHSMKVPSTLAGKPVVVYSTSSNAFVRAPEGNWGYNTKTPWGDQIDIALGSSANSRNLALPGSYAEDICTAAYGTKANYSTRATLADPMAISRACTFATLPATDALYLVDQIGNNIISAVDSAQVQASMTNAIRSLLRRIRTANGGVFVTSQNAAITYAGTWTNGTSDGCTGGIYKQSTVPGSTGSISVNNTTGAPHQWEVVLVGLDGGGLSLTGASFAVKVDGATVATGTTHNQAKATGWGGGADYKFVQMTVPVTIPTGVHTLSWEHTGASGDVLRVDSVQVGSATPPWIVCNTLGRMPADAYTTLPQLSLAKQAAYSTILQNVCAEFTDKRVLFYDPSASGIVNGQTELFASDLVHQREALMTNYAWEIMHDCLLPRVA